MKKYLVTVRLLSGGNTYYECDAASEFDAKQQAGWAYVREGIAIDAHEV